MADAPQLVPPYAALSRRARERAEVRVVVADRDQPVRDALRALLVQDLGMKVVGEADNAATLKSQVQEHKPDLVVVAWNLVASRAPAVLAGLRVCPALRIVVVGLRPETRRIALAAGADGFACKVDPPDRLIRVLTMAAEESGLGHSEPTDSSGTRTGETS